MLVSISFSLLINFFLSAVDMGFFDGEGRVAED